jgi:hypothetical protein
MLLKAFTKSLDEDTVSPMQTDGLDLFLSYSRKDEQLVTPLYHQLVERGVRVFLDTKSLTPGEYFEERIFADIERSRAYGLVLTRNSLASDWVHREYLYAKGLFDAVRLRLIPLQFEKDARMPEAIQQHNILQFWNADKFLGNVQHLIFPGIVSRKVEVFMIEGGSGDGFARLRRRLQDVHEVGTAPIDDLYRSRHFDKVLHDTGAPRAVFVIDLFSGWPDSPSAATNLGERIEFVFRMRARTRNGPNPIVFILLHSSRAMKRFETEIIKECGTKGWARLQHYFQLHTDLPPTQFDEGFDATWAKVLREFLRIEHGQR